MVAEIDRLADEIEATGRGYEVANLAEELQSNPNAARPVDEPEWKHLLPEERSAILPAYYLTLRAELITLERNGRKQRARLNDWLDGTAPKVVVLAANTAIIGEAVHGALHAAGVLAHENQAAGPDDLRAIEGLASGLDGPA